jgi:hypothetical protein
VNAANQCIIDFDIRFFTDKVGDPVDKEVNEYGQDGKQDHDDQRTENALFHHNAGDPGKIVEELFDDACH